MIDYSNVGFDPTRNNAIIQDLEVKENKNHQIETPDSGFSRGSLSTDSRVAGAVVLGVGPTLEACDKGDVVLYVSERSYSIDNEGTKIVEENSILAIGANLSNDQIHG